MLRVAGSPIQDLFARTVLLAPYLGYVALTNQPNSGGWANLDFPRILALMALRSIGIDCCEALPVLAYAVPPNSAQAVVPAYTDRLRLNFGSHWDFRTDLAAASRPLTIYCGADDELMIASKYAEAVRDFPARRCAAGARRHPHGHRQRAASRDDTCRGRRDPLSRRTAMTFQDIGFDLTTAGANHAVLTLACIGIGLIQFLGVKGTPVHRALGYDYRYGMLAADGTALMICQCTGRFNLHVGANVICLVAAMLPVLHDPRSPNWRARHYRWMSASYVGSLAAAATDLVVRTMPFSAVGQIWIATAEATTGVTAVGCILIRRYHRIAAPNRASHDLAEPA